MVQLEVLTIRRDAHRDGLLRRSLALRSRNWVVRPGRPWSLRWIVTHMIEEYARHNGHADLLRECVDGSTGYY